MTQINSLAYRKVADLILSQVVYVINSLNNRLIIFKNNTYEKRVYKTYNFKAGECVVKYHELNYSKDEFKQSLIDDGYLQVIEYIKYGLENYLIKDLDDKQELELYNSASSVLSSLPNDILVELPYANEIDECTVYKLTNVISFALSLGYNNFEKYNIIFAYLAKLSLNVINNFLYC